MKNTWVHPDNWGQRWCITLGLQLTYMQGHEDVGSDLEHGHGKERGVPFPVHHAALRTCRICMVSDQMSGSGVWSAHYGQTVAVFSQDRSRNNEQATDQPHKLHAWRWLLCGWRPMLFMIYTLQWLTWFHPCMTHTPLISAGEDFSLESAPPNAQAICAHIWKIWGHGNCSRQNKMPDRLADQSVVLIEDSYTYRGPKLYRTLEEGSSVLHHFAYLW